MEEWKLIPGSCGYYVSNYGRVKNSDRKQYNILTDTYSVFKGRILSPTDSFGYKYVGIKFLNGKTKRMRVHILVATYFIENENMLTIVNHKDGNKSNNLYTNLEWVTNSENVIHAYKTGLIDINNFIGINSSQSTPYLVINKEKDINMTFDSQKSAMKYFMVGKTVFKSKKFIDMCTNNGFIIKKISKEEFMMLEGSTTIL